MNYSELRAMFARSVNQIISPKSLLPAMLRPGSSGEVLVTNSSGIADWASSGLPTWTTIERASGRYGGGSAANTYLMAGDSVNTSGSNFYSTPDLGVIRLSASDYAVSGKTTQVRVLVAVLNNTVSPGVSVGASLNNVTGTTGAAATTVGVTINGTPVATATATTAAGVQFGAGAGVSFPADGSYALCLVISGGATAANSAGVVVAQLQIRHV